jgi:hypothetical protein
MTELTSVFGAEMSPCSVMMRNHFRNPAIFTTTAFGGNGFCAMLNAGPRTSHAARPRPGRARSRSQGRGLLRRIAGIDDQVPMS